MSRSAEILELLAQRRITPDQARDLLAAAEPPPLPGDGAIAVVGMSGRYAGSRDLGRFWESLKQGRDEVSTVPPRRWAGLDLPDGFELPSLGALDDLAEFDAALFEVTPVDAAVMDPQQRLVLEEAYDAFADAGYSRRDLRGSRCGVFVGIVEGDYGDLCRDAGRERFNVLAAGSAMAAARVSYFFDLRGTAVSVDTACSSSLVATHMAVEALRRGEVDLALVAGASLYLSPGSFEAMTRAGMLAQGGRCRAFSDDADGFVPGEGAAAIVLRRAVDAEADADAVHGYIIASGTNQDGHSNGITAPNLAAQSDLLKEVYERAGIDPASIGTIEAHGTGTRLGDPIELQALAEAFAGVPRRSVEIGSVKSNVGHTSAVAGLAGLQKSLLQMRHGMFVPTLHVTELNRHFDFASSPFDVTTSVKPWPVDPGRARRAGVSSFGFSGTNSHVVLQGATPRPVGADVPDGGRVALLLASRTEEQLREYAARIGAHLRSGDRGALVDIASVLSRRDPHRYRLAAVADSADALAAALMTFANGTSAGTEDVVFTSVVTPRGVTGDAVDVGGGDAAAEIARGWLTGADTTPLPGRRVHVPPPPHARTRYWLEDLPAAAEPHGDGITGPAASGPDGMVDKPRLSGSSATADTAESDRDASLGEGVADIRQWRFDRAVLDEHMVGGHRVVPGAALLALAAEETCHVAARRARLRGAVWHRSVVAEGNEPRLAVERQTEGEGTTALRVSHASTDDLVFEVTGEPMQRLRPRRVPPLTDPRRVDVGEFYGALATGGVDYGPSYQRIRSLAVGSDGADAVLELSDDPTTRIVGGLDAVLHTVAPLTSVPGAIPFAADTIDVHLELPQRIVVHARTRTAADVFDIVAVDEAGEPVVSVEGLVLRGPAPGADALLVRARENTPIAVPEVTPATAEDLVIDAQTAATGSLDAVAARIADADRVGRVVVDARTIPTDAAGARRAARLGVTVAAACAARLAAGTAEPFVILVLATEDGVAPRALAGLLRVAELELLGSRVRTLVVDATLDGDVLRRVIDEEHGDADPTHRVVTRKGARRELRSTVELPARGGASFRSGGRYVLVGGAGGVGRVVAEHLASTYGARLLLVGRSAPNTDVEALLSSLQDAGAEASYMVADVADLAQADAVRHEMVARFGGVDGVFHTASVSDDGLLIAYDTDRVEPVVRAKADVLLNLDEVFAADPLDVFVGFSSLVPLLGNTGQAAYAYANAFVDAFMERRARLVREGARRGASVSIAWPFWAEGGITMTPEVVTALKRDVGLAPLPSHHGVVALEQAIGSGASHVLVAFGEAARLDEVLAAGGRERPGTERPVESTVPCEAVEVSDAFEGALAFVEETIANSTGIPGAEIDKDVEFAEYGIDSIAIMSMTRAMEVVLGELPKTLFFEHRTPAELATRLAGAYGDRFTLEQQGTPAAADATSSEDPVQEPGEPGTGAAGTSRAESIAVIGLAGRYPGSRDLRAFWRHLVDGDDLVTQIPVERWDWRDDFEEHPGTPGTTYTRWGGFVDDVDRFDAEFFNIAPVEAELLDPQVRLFLETAWHAVEDAGYTPEGLGASQVGVFVGVMYGMWEMLRGDIGGHEVPLSSSFSAIANRVSHAMNLRGPSFAVDSMCSSSLTALHLAVQSLRRGECRSAIVGGVNLTLHPDKNVLLSLGSFGARDGRCRSFGEGGSGYVAGEGVGAVVLKPLAEAERDGDRILGVIRGSAVGAGGRTSGFTVPDPVAQADVIRAALTDAEVSPGSIDYLEAHGTGTALGDPIEIAGLGRVFGPASQSRGRSIGSVKSNVGHLEAAAGVVALSKVLLQLDQETLVPSLHSQTLNPNISFDESPFVVQQSLGAWPAGSAPRRAGISSFGAGGSNAHVVVEEAPPVRRREVAAGPEVYVLSARDEERLAVAVDNLATHLRELRRQRQAHDAAPQAPGIGTMSAARDPRERDAWVAMPWSDGVDAASVARTLQVGRVTLPCRLAVVADGLDELIDRLASHGAGRGARVHTGKVPNRRQQAAARELEGAVSEVMARAHSGEEVADELAGLWVSGAEIDWDALRGGDLPGRVSLPGYPFAPTRYPIPAPRKAQQTAVVRSGTSADRVMLTGAEAFAGEHSMGGQTIMPASVVLDLMLRRARLLMPEGSLTLRHLAWPAPVPATGDITVEITSGAETTGGIELVARVRAADGVPVEVCRATAVAGAANPGATEPEPVALEQAAVSLDGHTFYQHLAERGAHYGPRLRLVTDVRVGEQRAVTTVAAPHPFDPCSIADPAVVDALLQSALALRLTDNGAEDQPRVPFAVRGVAVLGPCHTGGSAVVTPARSGGEVDVQFIDNAGQVCLELVGVSYRPLPGGENDPTVSGGPVAVPGADASELLFVPSWHPAPSDARGDVPPHRIIVVTGETARLLEHVPTGSSVVTLPAPTEEVDGWFTRCVVEFADVVRPLTSVVAQPTLVQLLVPSSGPAAVARALAPFGWSAAGESERLRVQLIETDATDPAELARQVSDEAAVTVDAVRYEGRTRLVRSWEPATESAAVHGFGPSPTVVITGGAGGLGLLLAESIVAESPGASVLLVGRAELSAEKRAVVADLDARAVRVEYRPLDITDADAVRTAIASFTGGHVTALVHAAGVLADGYLVTVSDDDIARVLAPKVSGFAALAKACSTVAVDEWILYSSMAAVRGNPGQAAYAAANAFLTEAADALGANKVTVIDWPLWRDGGMAMPEAAAEVVRERTGLHPITTESGIALLHRARAAQERRVLPMVASPSAATALLHGSGSSQERTNTVEPTLPDQGSGAVEAAVALVSETLAEQLKMPRHRIRPSTGFDDIGLNSVLAMRLVATLEHTLGSLPKTLFFEFDTVADLAGYLANEHGADLPRTQQVPPASLAAGTEHVPPTGVSAMRSSQSSAAAVARTGQSPATAPTLSPTGGSEPAPQVSGHARADEGGRVQPNDIAIVGLAGRYPGAETVTEFWENLIAGTDSVTGLPADRWEAGSLPAELRDRRGGFLTDVAAFDPLFFSISPAEALRLDPQERLFLQTAYHAIEDSGYRPTDLADDAEVGVFVGVMYEEYQLYGAEDQLRGGGRVLNGPSSSVANRVSYTLGLKGPSLAVDTMCSSSLVALHMAVRAILDGDCSAAIAGGVNVTVHPNKLRMLAGNGMLSRQGRCAAFGAGGDGYVPGEGVGAVVLKPLHVALRDGDHVYGVVKGTAVNHGGHTSGYTVPDPAAQTAVITKAMRRAGGATTGIGYVEAHGTGTSLGDPIEIRSLAAAFGAGVPKGSCRIGSVKTNIGHCESAAGVAGLTKVLLQMQHGTIVPSLHAAELNPMLDLEKTPFVVAREATEWPAAPGGLPRRAGLSAFGAGGTNAHVILEEPPAAQPVTATLQPRLVPLSAVDQRVLRESARRLLARVRELPPTAETLRDVAFTLQAGRRPMAERVAFLVTTTEELISRLSAYADDPTSARFAGRVSNDDTLLHLFDEDGALRSAVHAWLREGKYEELAAVWVHGVDVEWAQARPRGARRVSLPGYPFAAERYWAPDEMDRSASPSPRDALANVSTFAAQRYRIEGAALSSLMAEHLVGGTPTLPAVALLVLVAEGYHNAIDTAGSEPSVDAHGAGRTGAEDVSDAVAIENVVFLSPVAGEGVERLDIELVPTADGARFEVVVNDRVVCAGDVVARPHAEDVPVQWAAEAATSAVEAETGEAFYDRFGELGLQYRGALRSVKQVWPSTERALARLQVTSPGSADMAGRIGLLDGGLQASAALTGAASGQAETTRLKLPFSIRHARIAHDVTATSGWALATPTGEPDLTDIVVGDEDRMLASLVGVQYREAQVCGDEPHAALAVTHVPSVQTETVRSVGAVHGSAPTECPRTEQAPCPMLFTTREAQVASRPGRAGARTTVVLHGFGDGSDATASGIASELPGDVEVRHLPEVGPTEGVRAEEAHVAVLTEAACLVSESNDGPSRLVVVTSSIASGLGGIAAALRTAALEQPDFEGRVIEVADDPRDPVTRRLVTEEVAKGQPNRVVIRGGRVWGDTVEEITGGDEAPAWSTGDVVLITGGTGGLGRLLAVDAVRAGAARVVVAGRSRRTEDIESWLAGDECRGVVEYRRADVSRRDEALALVDGVLFDHGHLDVLVHAAGAVADDLLARTSEAALRAVLAPKVAGTLHLDEAVGTTALDRFILAGSLAGVTGNVGQAGYAAANGFMAQFARRREARRAAGECNGRTVTLQWPLWRDGGLRVEGAVEAGMAAEAGLVPLSTDDAFTLLRRALAAEEAVAIPVVGRQAQVTDLLRGAPDSPTAAVEPPAPGRGEDETKAAPQRTQPSPTTPAGSEAVAAATTLVTGALSRALRIPPERLDASEPFASYGVDSIMVMAVTKELETQLGALPKTLLFDHQTIASLATRLAETHRDALVPVSVPSEADGAGAAAAVNSSPPGVGHPPVTRRTASGLRTRFDAPRTTASHPAAAPGNEEPIAIVGLAGRFPGADDIEEFWRNLAAGVDSVTECPAERAASLNGVTPEGIPLRRRGGFVDGVDRFDTKFFRIPPVEAEVMDPQERLFLETAWAVVENAGYTRASLGFAPGTDVRRSIGVYVGVMNEEYQHWAVQSRADGNPAVASGNASSVANRVSHFFDLHGPSLALDTMCSSALVAIHLAVQAIRSGECEAAIAGGVNVLAHPNHFVNIESAGMVSSDGLCRSYGEGGDGYVPAEGVGAVLLKPLSAAIADGDAVWGVIRGSAVNHGGRTNGYTVPNPRAQRAVIEGALKASGVDPESVGYVEGHGTGTALGDPIEVTALTETYPSSADNGPRLLGSVKSNIGHAESAAGVAALAKVLLQLRAGAVAPSLHSTRLNPHLDLDATAWRVPQQVESWTRRRLADGRMAPRTAGISSFGAGGTNAHLVVEQYEARSRPVRDDLLPVIVLSADDEPGLRRLAADLAAATTATGADVLERADLLRIAFTLQTGRETGPVRAAFVASDAASWAGALEAIAAGRSNDLVHRGHADVTTTPASVDNSTPGGPVSSPSALDVAGATQACQEWVRGVPVRWADLYGGLPPQRVHLPGRRFGGARFWLDIPNVGGDARNASTGGSSAGTGESVDRASVLAAVIEAFARALKMPAADFGETTTLEELGLDSIYVTTVTRELRAAFGDVPASVLFAKRSIGAIADHLLAKGASPTAPPTSPVGGTAPEPELVPLPAAEVPAPATSRGPSSSPDRAAVPIAVVGMNGQYPQASSLEEYAANLRAGKDSVSEIPRERWDHRDFPEVACRWGGFIDGPFEFDPQFFGIAPGAVEYMDPQERLFLRSAWQCVEDAGYVPAALDRVAVFAGVSFNQYGLFGAESFARGVPAPVMSQIFSVANRVSYVLDLTGPSQSVDTACSSSLYAVHQAVQAIRRGEADAAIAGGVNLTLHPSKYVTLTWNSLLASDGHCRAFGAGGDGYVPGEGVGTVMLKPLPDALAAGDHVYGVIHGSAVNHGGRANGYFAPNPEAQEAVVEAALADADIAPDTVSYVEAHGTGTALGDPVEVDALTAAFGDRAGVPPCLIGSVKGNIGHLEAAAGIAQLHKVLLQLRDGRIYPSRTNAPELNPEIDFESGPFRVALSERDWLPARAGDRTGERIAGISSFGVGGLNVHLIVGEAPTRAPRPVTPQQRMAFPLVARREADLPEVARLLLDRLAGDTELDLADVACTLQSGRESFPHRVVVLADDRQGLMRGLESVAAGGSRLETCATEGTVLVKGTGDRADGWAAWVNGGVKPAVEWEGARRVSLPTTPMNPSRYAPRRVEPTGREEVRESTPVVAQDAPVAHATPGAPVPGPGAAPLLAGPPAQAVETAVVVIREVVSTLLGFRDGDRADVSTSFFDLGLESVLMRQTHDRVQADLAFDFEFQMMFDHPTVQGLAMALVDLARTQGPATESGPGRAEPAVLETMLAVSHWDTDAPGDADTLGGEPEGTVVVFGGAELAEKWREAAPACRIVPVRDASSFTRTENGYALDLTSRAQLVELFEAMTADGVDATTLVHGCALDEPGEAVGALPRSFLVLQAFCSAVAARSVVPPPALVLVVPRDEHVPVPELSAMGAYARSAKAEDPRLGWRLIHWDRSSNSDAGARAVWHQLHGAGGDIEVSDRVHVESLVEHVAGEATVDLPPTGGVYVVTGGLGGAARILARHLAATQAASLVLVGRSAPGERSERFVGQLGELGGQAIYVDADVSTRDGAERVRAATMERFGAVTCILHAAGVVHDGPLAKQTPEGVRTASAPKLAGARCLEAAFADTGLRLIVLFSSLTARFGNAGQSAYAYANGSLEAQAEAWEAERRRGTRSHRTVAVAWPFWRDGGMRTEPAALEWMERNTGLVPLDEQAAVKAYEQAVRVPAPTVMVLHGHADRIRRVVGLAEAPARRGGDTDPAEPSALEPTGVPPAEVAVPPTPDDLLAGLDHDQLTALLRAEIDALNLDMQEDLP